MQDANIIYSLPSWGSSILTFALSLALLTQALKTRLKTHIAHLPAYLVQLATVALGLGLAALIDSQGLLVDPLFATMPKPLNWLLFGAIGGVGAIGGYDLIMQIAKVMGGKKPATLPTLEQAETELNSALGAAPRLALETLRRLAVGFGIPSFVTEVILSENTLEEAERMIKQMGKTRALAPEEITTNMAEWEKKNAVIVAPEGGQV